MEDENKSELIIGNYIKQANFLTSSVILNISEVQKDALYFIMQNIDYHSKTPTDKIIIDFDKFLSYKKVTKNNFYSIGETLQIMQGMRDIKGSFRNQYTGQFVTFNLIDNVSMNPASPNEFEVKLAEYGVIFLYEKALSEYVEKSKSFLPDYKKQNNSGKGFTQIEKNVVSLNSTPQKKLFEMLSRFKSKGWMRITLFDLKLSLGFITIKLKGTNISAEAEQLGLIFSNEETNDIEKVEKLAVFSDFKRRFLDGAIREINNNPQLDITNLKFTTIKTGNKVTTLHFTFKKKMNKENMSEEELKCYKYFIDFGLTESQIFLVLDRIGYENMYASFNAKIASKKSSYGYKFYDITTNSEIKNLAGFLYEKVFNDYLKD
ncbi:replication initiation protein [Chryseobacterium sp. SL1]|uniref:replication initiation protein n=1 Tax=Chryseobacterium sp. SL1 TaxID=2995159 RepID=UPI00227624E1|nr:replication initiation protein [Chryseobacterium sp. SL1]MCY1659295.1 replication initiation protein [Chryseobacterium sp. SL1]